MFLDWRITIHWNSSPRLFQYNHIYQGCLKNATITFQCIVVLQSRGQGPEKMENYGTNISPSFNKNQDLVPWIGEQQYIEMLLLLFANNPDKCCYVGKLQEHNFSVWLFSNPRDKILILVEILWIQDLKVQLRSMLSYLSFCDGNSFLEKT